MTTRTPHIACHEYHLPAHISKVVDFVTPSVHFDARVKQESFRRRLRKPAATLKRDLAAIEAADRQIEKNRAKVAANVGMELGSLPKQGAVLADSEVLDAQALEGCDRQITPNCVRALYQFGPGETAQQQNTLG